MMMTRGFFTLSEIFKGTEKGFPSASTLSIATKLRLAAFSGISMGAVRAEGCM